MRRTADADSLVRYNIKSRVRVRYEAVARIRAQIHFMISARDSERLRDFARAGAKLTDIIHATPAFHQFDPSPRLEGTNQDKAVRIAFHQHVQHPVNAVVEIHISRAGSVALHEASRARAR